MLTAFDPGTRTLPATCAPEVIDQHREHFAVEFRNWILAATRSGSEAQD